MAKIRIDFYDKLYRDMYGSSATSKGVVEWEGGTSLDNLEPTPEQVVSINKLENARFTIHVEENGEAKIQFC